jgi:hypothetical protein
MRSGSRPAPHHRQDGDGQDVLTTSPQLPMSGTATLTESPSQPVGRIISDQLDGGR